MVEFTASRLKHILDACSQKRVLVIGDLMIDRYLWGEVTRISPEAPVPIINISDEEIRFGGAANVANNIIGLGAQPVLLGAVGNDRWGEEFKRMIAQQGWDATGLVVDDDRPTTLKTRIIGNNQHIARVDREERRPTSKKVQNQMLEKARDLIKDCDAIILEDYNKGVLVSPFVENIIRLSHRHQKVVTVDPKFDNFLSYRGVTLFKPNKKETEEALAIRIETDDDVRRAAHLLRERMEAQGVLITLGARGMALLEAEGEVTFSHTHAREVADVSGAGDTVIATVTVGLCAGASMKEAVSMANYAAGVVCEEVGVVPITREHLEAAILAELADGINPPNDV